MEKYIYVINTLAPVFVIILLGAILRKMGFLTAEFIRSASKLTFWVGLPCLLFSKVAQANVVAGQASMIAKVVLGGMTACILVALVIALILRMPARQVGTFVQASFRGNLAYISLAVIFLAFANGGGNAGGEKAQSMAALSLAIIVPIYNIISVVALLLGQHRLGWQAIWKMLGKIATNPLLLSTVGGYIWLQTGKPLPAAVLTTCETTGQFALPLALLCVGATLASTPIRGRVVSSMLAGIIKVGISPVAGYFIADLLGADAQEKAIAMIMLAVPTAIASYVMADQMDGDSELAAGGIVASTFLSIISLTIVVAMMA